MPPGGGANINVVVRGGTVKGELECCADRTVSTVGYTTTPRSLGESVEDHVKVALATGRCKVVNVLVKVRIFARADFRKSQKVTSKFSESDGRAVNVYLDRTG